MTTALYVPGTSEKDMSKVIMSAQLVAGQTAANTDAIATLNAATYVNSIAGNHGAFTLSTGLTNSTNDIRLSMTNATGQYLPSNPSGTTSATGVMMGLGGTCVLTPVYGSRVLLLFSGTGANTVSTASLSIQARYGTSTAPINGAALTGTTIGPSIAPWVPAANGSISFGGLGGIITGLSSGTAYWFDVSLAVSSGTGTLVRVGCSVMEF